jgi:type VI secretion system protein ImpB
LSQPPPLDTKDRVSISYKSSRPGSDDELELPFKILVLGDFSQSAGSEPLEERQSLPVTRADLDAVLRSFGIVLHLLVDNHLAPGAEGKLRLDLGFGSLADFEPDRLVEQSGPLKELADRRQALKTLRRLLTAHPALTTRLQAIAADPDRLESFQAFLRSKVSGLIKY